MRGRNLLIAGCVCAAFFVVGATAQAPATGTTTAPAADADQSTWREAVAGADATLLAATSTAELSLELAPASADELAQRAGEALTALERVGRALADASVRLLRLTAATPLDAEQVAAVRTEVDALRTFRSDLVARTNVILAAWKAKGGDVTAAQAYVTVVDHLEPPQAPTAAAAPESDTERQQQELDARVAAAVTRIRQMPPVHERPEPWTVSTEELGLELQPLRKEEVKERVEAWQNILQTNLRQRIRLDIALSRTEDPAERQALADRATAQQTIVTAVVERMKVALRVLKERGGDTAEYEDYIANATGQRLNLTDPGILGAQISAWLRSTDGGVRVGLNLLKFVGILLAFWIVARILGWLTTAALHRVRGSSMLLRHFMVGLVRRTTMIVGLVVALGALGLDIGPLVAAIGAAGLVIGFALQGTLSNFASGILILITRPFDVGDAISAGGVVGKVDAMSLVSTRILTFDNQVMLVPNNQIWNGVITNITALDTRRVDMQFGISYGDDIGKAQAVIEETLKAHPKVLPDPAPIVRVSELADSSVNFIARPWARTVDYWDVYWDLTRTVKERLEAAGISIPFPQRDVHLVLPEGGSGVVDRLGGGQPG